MQFTASDYYQQKIQQAQKELDEAREQLKQQEKMQPKARKRLHHKISKLYEELRDWKYRAAYLDFSLSPTP